MVRRHAPTAPPPKPLIAHAIVLPPRPRLPAQRLMWMQPNDWSRCESPVDMGLVKRGRPKRRVVAAVRVSSPRELEIAAATASATAAATAAIAACRAWRPTRCLSEDGTRVIYSHRDGHVIDWEYRAWMQSRPRFRGAYDRGVWSYSREYHAWLESKPCSGPDEYAVSRELVVP